MKRHPLSPILTRKDILGIDSRLRDVSSVFNPGGIRWQGKTTLLLRVQNRARQTLLVKAISKDGLKFVTDVKPVSFHGVKGFADRIFHIYDPRIVRIGERFLVTCAMDTESGCRVGIFGSEDLEHLEFISLLSDADQRNGVLFPELIDGRYLMLSRPNEITGPDGVRSGDRIGCYSSADLYSWREEGELMKGQPHYWDELIGSGPPPIRTPIGWLHIYHGVATHFGGGGIYQAGLSLLDLKEPWKTIVRGPYNVLEPREPYETCGQVPNVVFPTAAIPMTDAEVDLDTPIYLYYGAADTCVGLAVSTIQDLLLYSGIELSFT